MTDDIVTRLRNRCTLWRGGETQRLMLVAADEIERLRNDRNRWRSIADSLAEAGTHPTAHHVALEVYEEACRG
jgi:hypothetical protein